ncbi:MAG TPA: MBL fold metallo-hydrolase [Streptosporangiaceae bacterium]
MRLTIIGCSGSFPGPESPASSYLLEAEGFRMLLDLGNGALGVMQRHAGLFDIDAICLSHLHADHCLDLCSYWVARQFAPDGPKPPVPVYGPARTAERMAQAYGLDPEPGMSAAFDFVTMTPGTRRIGPFAVTTGHVNHPVETFGFRIEHGGRVLAYSADTGPSDTLITLARQADLLLCEASFLDGPGLPEGLHMSGRQAGEHAARAGVGHLVLTHLVPWNDKQRSFDEAGDAFGGKISLAASGQAFDLVPSGPLPL